MAFFHTLAAGLVAASVVLAANALDHQIEAKVRKFPGAVSIYAKNLDTGATCTRRGDEPVRTASTIKLAVMVEVFAAVAEGHAKWSETLVLRDSAG